MLGALLYKVFNPLDFGFERRRWEGFARQCARIGAFSLSALSGFKAIWDVGILGVVYLQGQVALKKSTAV